MALSQTVETSVAMHKYIDLHVTLSSPYPNRNFSINIKSKILAHGITALFGPSGSGKTTILRALTGLPKQRSAQITVDNRALQNNSIYIKPEARGFIYVGNERQLFPHMTIQQNWRYAQQNGQKRKANSVSAHKQAQPISASQSIDPALLAETFNLSHLMNALPRTLSTGEAQKASILAAILSAPQMLLLDEPLGNIDYSEKQKLVSFIKQTSELCKVPMLYVSHHPNEVNAIADEIIFIQAGHVIASGPLSELKEMLYKQGKSQTQEQRKAPEYPTCNAGVISLDQPTQASFRTCRPGTITKVMPLEHGNYSVHLSTDSGTCNIEVPMAFVEQYKIQAGLDVYYCEI